MKPDDDIQHYCVPLEDEQIQQIKDGQDIITVFDSDVIVVTKKFLEAAYVAHVINGKNVINAQLDDEQLAVIESKNEAFVMEYQDEDRPGGAFRVMVMHMDLHIDARLAVAKKKPRGVAG